MLGLSSHALSKIMSSFMVLTSDGAKHNLGLSLKFEAKSLKVIGYSRKADRYWEFSDKAVELLREYKVGRIVDFATCLLLNADLHSRNTLTFSTTSLVTSVIVSSSDCCAETIDLLTCFPEMAEADEIFPNADRPDAKVKEVRQWLKAKGVLDFEAVSLFCDQLDQV